MQPSLVSNVGSSYGADDLAAEIAAQLARAGKIEELTSSTITLGRRWWSDHDAEIVLSKDEQERVAISFIDRRAAPKVVTDFLRHFGMGRLLEIYLRIENLTARQ